MKSESLSVAEERHAIELIRQPGSAWHGLFLFSNPSGTEWHFVNAKHKDPMSPTSGLLLRRLRVKGHAPSNSVVRSLAPLDYKNLGESSSSEGHCKPHMIKRLICRA